MASLGAVILAVVLVAAPFLLELRPTDDRLGATASSNRRTLELAEEKDRALAALKELEFDHRTGKLRTTTTASSSAATLPRGRGRATVADVTRPDQAATKVERRPGARDDRLRPSRHGSRRRGTTASRHRCCSSHSRLRHSAACDRLRSPHALGCGAAARRRVARLARAVRRRRATQAGHRARPRVGTRDRPRARAAGSDARGRSRPLGTAPELSRLRNDILRLTAERESRLRESRRCRLRGGRCGKAEVDRRDPPARRDGAGEGDRDADDRRNRAGAHPEGRLSVQPTQIEPPAPVPVPEPYPPPDEGTPPQQPLIPEPSPPPDEGTPPLPEPVPEPGPRGTHPAPALVEFGRFSGADGRRSSGRPTNLLAMARRLLLCLLCALVVATPAAGGDIHRQKRKLDERISTLNARSRQAGARRACSPTRSRCHREDPPLQADVGERAEQAERARGRPRAHQRRLNKLTTFQAADAAKLDPDPALLLRRARPPRMPPRPGYKRTPELKAVDVMLSTTSMPNQCRIPPTDREPGQAHLDQAAAGARRCRVREETRTIKDSAAAETADQRDRRTAARGRARTDLDAAAACGCADLERPNARVIRRSEKEFRRGERSRDGERRARGEDPCGLGSGSSANGRLGVRADLAGQRAGDERVRHALGPAARGDRHRRRRRHADPRGRLGHGDLLRVDGWLRRTLS